VSPAPPHLIPHPLSATRRAQSPADGCNDKRAEVIKVEHPQRGDDTRAWGPPFAAPTRGSGPGESAYFLSVRGPVFLCNVGLTDRVARQVNRNKKSVGVSFAHERGVGILHALAAGCDVLVENYLPGGLRKYSLDYEAVRKLNPGIIYASITGYGQTGPYSSRAGYDVMVEA
jgi:succinate---hydroxymethylglutarate CoA-transferase